MRNKVDKYLVELGMLTPRMVQKVCNYICNHYDGSGVRLSQVRKYFRSRLLSSSAIEIYLKHLYGDRLKIEKGRRVYIDGVWTSNIFIDKNKI